MMLSFLRFVVVGSLFSADPIVYGGGGVVFGSCFVMQFLVSFT